MFRRVFERGPRTVEFTFEGERVVGREGDTVAAALLGAGHVVLRSTPVSGDARGPFCMMGACFECLVEIDAVPNQQACMTQVAPGMRVRRMRGARSLDGPASQSPEFGDEFGDEFGEFGDTHQSHVAGDVEGAIEDTHQ